MVSMLRLMMPISSACFLSLPYSERSVSLRLVRLLYSERSLVRLGTRAGRQRLLYRSGGGLVDGEFTLVGAAVCVFVLRCFRAVGDGFDLLIVGDVLDQYAHDFQLVFGGVERGFGLDKGSFDFGKSGLEVGDLLQAVS
jgi:hypothetical protein